MASSLKSAAPSAREALSGRRRPALAPDLVLAPPRRTYSQAQPIPGAVAAYAWLAAGLVIGACALAFVLWLAAGLPIDRIASWPGWRAI